MPRSNLLEVLFIAWISAPSSAVVALIPVNSWRIQSTIVAPCSKFASHWNPLPKISLAIAKSSSSASVVSSNEDLLPGIAAIDAMNSDLCDRLEALKDQPYFRLYSIDILGNCEYMPQEIYECYSETCEVYPVDEDEVGA